MTNKTVKPFAIRKTDDITDEMVQEILDKCVSLGAIADEGVVDMAPRNYNTTMSPKYWTYFGVSARNETLFSDSLDAFDDLDCLIGLDQLDGHLGIVTQGDDTCKSLRNVKIDLRKLDSSGAPIGEVDEELSRAFQEAVFASGGLWNGDTEPKVQLTYCPFLYVCGDGRICKTDKGSDTYFQEDDEKQITFTYERKLDWNAEYVVEEDASEKQTIQAEMKALEEQLAVLREKVGEL